MLHLLALLVFLGVPFVAIGFIAYFTSGKLGQQPNAARGTFTKAVASVGSVCRHPVKALVATMAQFVGSARRCLSKLEVRLNLVVVSETVQEKREQVATIEKLLSSIGNIGLKPSTIEALRAKAGATLTNANGLEAVSAGFNAQLQSFLAKEAELNTLKYLAAQVASLGLEAEAAQDIHDKLREALNAVEVERVLLAQAVELVAIKASHS